MKSRLLSALLLQALLAAGLPLVSQSGLDRPLAVQPAGAETAKPNPLDKIPCIRWIDEQTQPKAVLFCIHGLGLHKGTYENFGREMAKQGIVTYAIDIRGFGTWVQRKHFDTIDFDGAMSDIKKSLVEIHKMHPGLPVILLGESMGGAIAIHAGSLYPDLVDGIISSVPAGDRFNSVDNSLKIGVHAVFGGFNTPIDVGTMVISHATKKEDLKEKWQSDPLCRTKLSPNELMAFQKFMNENFDCAGLIKTTPILFIQGCNDKLVRPAGTWKLFDSLSTPNKQLVLSTSAEHLIFEEGQFSKDDEKFVTGWINKNILNPSTAQDTAVSKPETKPVEPTKEEVLAALPTPTVKVKPADSKPPQGVKINPDAPAISYWIELYRGGKVYRCNNKLAFKTGDAIRFHVIPQNSGYAYILMKQSSSGKKAILFPSKDTGTNNYLNAGVDYPLPYKDWLTFDNTPGIEKVSLLFSKNKVADETALNPPEHLTAYISDDMSGAKDLVPTRMQLSWDDPTPVILPDALSDNQALAANSTGGSLVKVVFNDPTGMLAVDVALAHQ